MHTTRRVIAGLFGLAAASLAFASLAATSLTATVQTQITAHYRGTNDLGSPTFDLNPASQTALRFENGTGANQMNALFADTRTIAASSSENLDLAGSLVDPLGATLTFVTVKTIKVCAAAANTNNVVVGGAGSNTFAGVFADATDKVNVKPGGCFLWVAPGTGATVTASTGDILLVANSGSGTGVTYDVIIMGTQ